MVRTAGLQHRSRANAISIASLRLVLALCLTLLCLGCESKTGAPPTARGGVLDLSASDLERNPVVALDGQWEFAWNRFVGQQESVGIGASSPESLIRLPSAWSGLAANGLEAAATGFATYRLLVLPWPGEHRLALRVFKVNSAYRLYVNGRLLGGSGIAGPRPEEETPEFSVKLFEFPSDGRPIEIMLHVSNFSYSDGGITSPLLFGQASALQALQARKWGVALFFAGALLVMGVYHIALYCFRPQSSSPLHLGLYCLLWLGNQLFSSSSDWVSGLFWGVSGSVVLEKIAFICLMLTVPIGYQFFRSLYPFEFPKNIRHYCTFMAVLFVVLTVFSPMLLLTELLPVYYISASIMICYCVYKLILACVRQRDNARLLLAGFVILGLAGINDMLDETGYIQTGSQIQVGLFFFLLFQALALSRRFSLAFSTVETLSTQLEGKNIALEREVAERARLQHEVVSISDDERRRLSHNLHDGLCQQLTGARLRCSVLEHRIPSEDTIAREVRQLSSLIDDTVGHAYDLSRGLWPVEHRAGSGASSLEELALRFSESSGIPITFRQDLPCAQCKNEHMTQLYRIAQEGIANAIKHAAPSRVDVFLECLDLRGVRLTIRDDGCGIAPGNKPRGGLGLKIMAHRAGVVGGDLRIDDAGDGGTIVTCTVACAAAEKSESTQESAG